MTPAYGSAISRIKKIAPETESAQKPRVTMTVRFAGAYRPKLAKMMHNQKTRMIRNGNGIGLSVVRAKSSQRDCARPVADVNACARNKRCASSCGESD